MKPNPAGTKSEGHNSDVPASLGWSISEFRIFRLGAPA